MVPSRNAAGYDLSRDDPQRHPKWTRVLYIVDRDGKLVESWDQRNAMFVRPHRVKINPYGRERHVWVGDDGAHHITKFTRDGKKVVMQLGKFREPGNKETKTLIAHLLWGRDVGKVKRCGRRERCILTILRACSLRSAGRAATGSGQRSFAT